MPKLMEKRDWIQTVANIGVAERVWSEQISTDDGILSMPTLEAGTYQVIFVKIDAKTPSAPPVRKSARDFIGWGLQFDSTPCSTDEWMKELAPALRGDVRAQDYFLSEIGISVDFEGKKDIVLAAHRAWHDHIRRKRKGEVVKRPIADVMIGAYAESKGGLITRNEDDFRTLFPNLTIFNPVSSKG